MEYLGTVASVTDLEVYRAAARAERKAAELTALLHPKRTPAQLMELLRPVPRKLIA